MKPHSFACLLALTAAAFAPPARAAEPAALPASPVAAIRNKLSAADLLSAESLLEVYGRRAGRDSNYFEALGWVARGAFMLGEPAKAARYAADVCRECDARLAAGADLALEPKLATALGAGVEVEAQVRERARGKRAAAAYLDECLARYAKPVSFRSRLHKRRNLIALRGERAPELAVEDWIGESPKPLASHRGRPVVLFVWRATCGDCSAQSATLARAVERWAPKGVDVLALTRYYEDDRTAEKAYVDSVWNATYRDVGAIPRVISTASMERYGGSSTPTFVFIGRDGRVRDYLPYRLDESELDRRIAAIAD